jgi:hypothetical protein
MYYLLVIFQLTTGSIDIAIDAVTSDNLMTLEECLPQVEDYEAESTDEVNVTAYCVLEPGSDA